MTDELRKTLERLLPERKERLTEGLGECKNIKWIYLTNWRIRIL